MDMPKTQPDPVRPAQAPRPEKKPVVMPQHPWRRKKAA